MRPRRHGQLDDEVGVELAARGRRGTDALQRACARRPPQRARRRVEPGAADAQGGVERRGVILQRFEDEQEDFGQLERRVRRPLLSGRGGFSR